MVKFEDPVFGQLEGRRAGVMWQMLCASQQGKEFRVILTDSDYRQGVGRANWEAFYTFSATGRNVHNRISAEFRFKDNLIISHHDSFDLHRWAGQAMGMKGLLIGWTPFFRKAIRQRSLALLDRFEARSSQT